MSSRGLTSGEIALLRTVYGDSIDYKSVVVKDGSVHEKSAVTFNNIISFPKNGYLNDFTATNDFLDKAWLVHEMAHIWQEQAKGVNLRLSGLWNLVSNFGNYDKSYSYSIHDDFSKMNIEQQAAALEDRFLTRNGYSPINCTDCPPDPGQAAYSTPNWTPIPRQSGQAFHGKVDTDSSANWTVKM